MKRGQGRYVLTLKKEEDRKEGNKEYELLATTRQLQKGKVHYEEEIDQLPNLRKYHARSELSQRLQADHCEWCGQEGQEAHVEVHHVRKVKDLKGKALWEQVMIERKRKTMILCRKCHDDLHAGQLSERNRIVAKEAV